MRTRPEGDRRARAGASAPLTEQLPRCIRMPPSPWWNTPRANVTPVAVLFFHINKAGGGSISSWLMRHNPRFTLKLEYFRARLFVSLHQELFPRLGAPWELGRAPVGRRPDWRTTAVAVEYHGLAHGLFWDHVEPQLPVLRRRYAAIGGRLLTLTTVRDPALLIVSWYRQWPPRLPNRTVAPFRPWLSNASGLLTRALAYPRAPWKIFHSTRVPFFPCPIELATLARRRLDGFDVVGDVADVGWALRTLVTCLGWSSAALPPTVPHVRYLGGQRDFTMRETNALASSSGPQHGTRYQGSARCRLQRAASCDRPLYESAMGGACRCAGVSVCGGTPRTVDTSGARLVPIRFQGCE